MALRKRCCLTLVAILLWSSPVFAQEPTSRLEGRVLRDGKGVADVSVLVAELRTVQITDAEGRFAFDGVPAGRYTVILTLGDNTMTQENVMILQGQTRQLDLAVEWEQLLRETVKVTAGAARAAKIVDAPAAVTSIPEEQIEREAAHGQVPKILEFTPGAEVTQSGLYDFNFNTRGFNSSLNRRVSTYIDGRDVGVVLLGAQEWSAIAGGLDDLASLEFIRGPSAALYGANASSGVINITTKSPRESEGTLLRLTAGQLDTLSADFRQAGEVGAGWYYKVLASVKSSGDFTVSRDPAGPDGLPGTMDDLATPEYSEFCPPETVGFPDCILRERLLSREQDNDIRFGSVRFDKHLGSDTVLSFEAGRSEIKGPVFQTGIGRVQNLDSNRPFYRFNFANRHWNLMAHYTSREGNQINLTKALAVAFADLITDDQRYGFEGQGHWNFFDDRVRFVIGAAHTEEQVDTTDPATGMQTVVYEPIETDRQAVFSQLDWRATDKVKLVFAGRVDKNTLHDTQFSPKVALVYSMTPVHSMRVTFNKAFQVANYSEYFLHTPIASFPIGSFVEQACVVTEFFPGAVPPQPPTQTPVDCGIPRRDANGNFTFIPILAVGNDDLELEKTQAWEVGYSGLIANRVFVTLDYYTANNDNFITDLVPQVGTSLGMCQPGDPVGDPTRCQINNDYLPWVSTDVAENTPSFINGPPNLDPNLTPAQALRNAVDNSVGGSTLGFRLAFDLDGTPVIVGRTYSNVGKVDTQGVDFGMQVFFNEAWSLQTSYSWFDFEILEANLDLGDVLLPNTPEHKASLSVSFRKNRWAATLSGRWVEGFRWAAGVFQGDVPDYTTEDLTASYAFNDRIEVGLNVANLRDSIHRQTYGGDLLSRRVLTNVTFTW